MKEETKDEGCEDGNRSEKKRLWAWNRVEEEVEKVNDSKVRRDGQMASLRYPANAKDFIVHCHSLEEYPLL